MGNGALRAVSTSDAAGGQGQPPSRRKSGGSEAVGQPINAQRLNAASLNVGQLEVILDGVANLEQFRNRVAQPTTMMTLNPLLEYHYLHQNGIAP